VLLRSSQGQKDMRFRVGEKEYSGESALDIINALQLDMLQDQCMNPRDFLIWSMSQLSDRIPLRELDVSDKLSNEMLALNYLYLRDEYGTGQLSDLGQNSKPQKCPIT
jgi:hypothetical protein